MKLIPFFSILFLENVSSFAIFQSGSKNAVQKPFLFPSFSSLWTSMSFEQSRKHYDNLESSSIHFCSGPNDIFRPTHLAITPDPPVRGEPLTIIFNGTLSQPITSGSTAHVTVKLGFIKLLDRDFDVCENAREIDEKCPVKEGKLDVYKVVDIPAQAPPGRYRIHVDAFLSDEDGGKPITCIDGDFRM